MPDISFTQPPEPPLRSDSGDDFATKADAFVSWQVVFAGELAANVSYFDDTLTTVAADRDAVAVDRLAVEAGAEAASISESKAGSSETAATAAQQASETALAETQALRDATEAFAISAAGAVVYQDLSAILDSKNIAGITAVCVDDTVLPLSAQIGTSWYNEALGTATRGIRRDMPALKVIVATTTTVTIYDGDDPSLPMWMVFSCGSDKIFNTAGAGEVTDLAMLNGTLCGSVSFRSMSLIDFARDEMFVGLGSIVRKVLLPIAEARSLTLFPNYTGSQNAFSFSATEGRGIAMTCRDDAPISETSGLPAPRIALAMETGVRLILEDRSVVASAPTTGFRAIDFDSEGGLWAGRDLANHRLIYAAPNEQGANFGNTVSSVQDGYPLLSLTRNNSMAVADGVVWQGGASHDLGAVPGISALAWDNGSFGDSLMALISTTFTTGYMPNDRNGCWLADTVATDLTDAVIWDVPVDETWITSGVYGDGAIEMDQSEYAYKSEGSVFVIGGCYSVAYQGSGAATVRQSVVDPVETVALPATVSFAPHELSSGRVQVFAGAGGADLSGVQVRHLVADRSGADRHMTIGGQIERSPVASGSELVAFGQKASNAVNFLELDGGIADMSGDFTVAVWVKYPGASGFVLGDAQPGFVAPYWYLGVDASANASFRFHDGVAQVSCNGHALTADRWHHIAMVVSGTDLSIYQDGILASTVSLPGNAFTNTSPLGRVFVRQDGGSLVSSLKLALLKSSPSAMTAEQIKYMFTEERRLFQAGALCTLGGGAPTVRGLSHDPSSKVTYALTGEGITGFSGLVRASWEAGTWYETAAAGGVLVKG